MIIQCRPKLRALIALVNIKPNIRMSANTNQVKALNKLITTLYDGENGYKESADDIENTALKARFQSLAQQRYDFGHEIKPFITQLGGEVDKGGSAAAGLHRVWIDLKSAVTGQDEEAVLNEIIRGEESAVKTYQEVLADNAFSDSIKTTLTNQLNKIQAVLGDMRRLEKIS